MELENATQSKPMIYKAMANIMRKVSAISKNSKNAQQGYSYRSVDDVFNELHDIFAEEGVFIQFNVFNKEIHHLETETNGKVSITHEVRGDIEYTFTAEDGSTVSTVVGGYALDRGDKAMGKLLSYSIKYALMHMFLIPTSDSLDPDKSSVTVTKPTNSISEQEAFTKIKQEIELVKTLDQLKALHQKYAPHSTKFSALFTEKKLAITKDVDKIG